MLHEQDNTRAIIPQGLKGASTDSESQPHWLHVGPCQLCAWPSCQSAEKGALKLIIHPADVGGAHAVALY